MKNKQARNFFNIVLVLAFAIVTASPAFADVKNVRVKEGKTLYSGSGYNLIWSGEPEAGVNKYSVWFVGGNLSNSESKFLGEAGARDYEFKFMVPNDIKPGSKFSIQLSGAGASGNQVDGLKIKKAKNDSLGKTRVMLKDLVGSVIYEGQNNLISWTGGKNIVKVGVKDSSGNVIGWIKLDGKPNGQLYWDTKKVCDLAMTTCWNTKDLIGQYGQFKLVVVSEDSLGNVVSGGDGNYDESDSYMAISSKANIPSIDAVNKSLLRYSVDEILKKVQTKFLPGSREYEAIRVLFQ